MFWHAWVLLVIAATCTEGNQSFRANCINEPNNKTACTRGCKPGYHGSFCKETCADHCDGACSQDTGHCLTGCKPNWFTSTCSQPCSGNCVDDVCDRRSAECLRGCKDGFYGLNCNETCSENCTEGKCDTYGGCDCEKGAHDKFCYIDCTDNCIGGACAVDQDGQLKCLQGCKEGRTGPFCNLLCPYDCPACDASCASRVMNRRVTRGNDDEYPNPTCEVFDVAGMMESATPNNCREDSNCQHGYRGPNCTIPCPACRYGINCSLYCAVGSWGKECHLTCPKNCYRATNEKSFCDYESGECVNCFQGFYGYLCELKCSRTCKQNYCSINNGSCSSGCKNGYWGQYCTNRCGNCLDMKCEQDGSCICKDKYYGPRCEVRCSEGCDGNCSITNDGNHMCNGECKVGYSGDDCKGGCPEDCRSSVCRRKDGTCAEETASESTSRSEEGPTRDNETIEDNPVQSTNDSEIPTQPLTTGEIVGIASPVLFFMIIIGICIWLYRMRLISCNPQSPQRREDTVDDSGTSREGDQNTNRENTEAHHSYVPHTGIEPENFLLLPRPKAGSSNGEAAANERTPERKDEPPKDHDTNGVNSVQRTNNAGPV